MSRFSGRLVSVGIAKESVRGNTAGSVDYWLPFATYNYSEKVQKVHDESGFGTLATPQGSDIIKEWSEGELVMNIRDLSIGLLLLSLFGTETFQTNQPQSGVGTHTFTLAESNQHQSLTVYKKDPVETMASGNVVPTSATIRAVIDQYVQVTFGMLGKKFGSDTAVVAYADETKFRPQDMSIKFAATANELAGASAIGTIRSINFTINKNSEDYQGLSSKTPTDFLNKDFVVSGEMELMFETAVYKNYVLLNQNRAASIKMTNSEKTIGTSTNPSLEFIFDELNFREFTPNYENSNIVMLTVAFDAIYNVTNARMLRAILINSRNTAY